MAAGVDHGDDSQRSEQPKADKTLLAVVPAIVWGGEHGTGEDDFGFLKTDAVFCAVGPFLLLIPFKLLLHRRVVATSWFALPYIYNSYTP